MSRRGALRRLPAALVLAAAGLAGSGAASAQENGESLGHIALDSRLGSDFKLTQIRADGFLNPGNILAPDTLSGHLQETASLMADYQFGLSLRLDTTIRWFNWNQDLPSDAIARSLVGGEPSLDIGAWELAWTSPDGLVNLGLGKQEWNPGPGRQLKAANYLEWLFGPVAKTMAWVGLNLDYGSVTFFWAPRATWVPELFWENGRQVDARDQAMLPGGDIYLLQGQLFASGFDGGIYLAYDDDFNAGLWFSLPLDKNLIVYGEGAFTTKSWMPYLDPAGFSLGRQRGNGLRAMAGVLWSPDFIDLSAYLETAYDGDAYTDADWQALGDTLATLDRLRTGDPARFGGLWTGTHGALANAWRYGSLSPWNLALHLKPNSLLGKVLDWSLSLNYSWPSLLYGRIFLGLDLGLGISLHATWDVPLALWDSPSPNPANVFMFQQNLTLSASLLAQTKLDL